MKTNRRKPKKRPKQSVGTIAKRALMETTGGKQLSRREVITRLAGLGLAGTGLGKFVPRWAQLSVDRLINKPEITVALIQHRGSRSIKHITNLIETARALGTPFDAMGTEGVNIASSKPNPQEYFVKEAKRLLDQDRKRYEKLIAQGMSKEKAIDEILPARKGDTPGAYILNLRRLSIIHNLPVAPIESYTKKEIARIHADMDIKHKAKLFKYPSLAEQTKHVERVLRENAQVKLIERNRHIEEKVPKVIRLLRQYHPHLKSRKKLRLLYLTGVAHFGLLEGKTAFYDYNHSFSPLPGHSWGLNIDHKINTLSSPALSRQEQRHAVLALNIDRYYQQLLDVQKFGEMRILISAMARITESEFRLLNKQTRGKLRKEREKIILQFLKKKK